MLLSRGRRSAWLLCIIVRRSNGRNIERIRELNAAESGERTNDTKHSVGVTSGNETMTALVTTVKETENQVLILSFGVGGKVRPGSA